MKLQVLVLFFSLAPSLLNQCQAQAENASPPAFLMHIGNKSLLKGNALEGNIPQEAWDKYIMGSGTRYGLVPYRRGLYGSTNFDSIEKYGDFYFGQKKIPWLMMIHIKPECRDPKNYSNLHKDPRFSEWVIANINELIANALECLHPEVRQMNLSCGHLLIGNALADGSAENKCDRLIYRFLEENKIKIVEDGLEDSSWYIRDRNCIENITADANTVIDALLSAHWDHKTRKLDWAGEVGAYGGAIFSILFGALSEDASITPEKISHLHTKASASDITPTYKDDSPDSQNFWIKREVPILLDAYERCQSTKNWEAFRAEAEKFETMAQTERAKRPSGFLSLVAETTAKLRAICQ